MTLRHNPENGFLQEKLIFGSYGGAYEEFCLLGCNTM
jgi:hypothetical protein